MQLCTINKYPSTLTSNEWASYKKPLICCVNAPKDKNRVSANIVFALYKGVFTLENNCFDNEHTTIVIEERANLMKNESF